MTSISPPPRSEEPAPERVATNEAAPGHPVLFGSALAFATLAAGAAAAWMLNRRREPAVEARTRDRLRAPPRHSQPPSAADIDVR